MLYRTLTYEYPIQHTTLVIGMLFPHARRQEGRD